MRRLHELDGLRAVAALLVVVAHFNFDPFKSTVVAYYVDAAHYYSLANLAVAFFYVLSAYLLTTLALRELSETGTFSRVRFLLRRVFRIWPLYWTMLILNIGITISQLPHFSVYAETWPWLRDHLWLYVLFLGNWSLAWAVPGFHADQSPPSLAILWSIAVEEQFYLVYAALAVAMLASGRRLAVTVALACVLGGSYRAWHLTQVLPQQQIYGLYYATPSYLEMFAFGAAAAWLVADGGPAGQRARAAMRSPVAILPIIWLLWTVASRWSGGFGHPLGPVFGYPLGALAMSLLVGWAVVNRESLSIRLTFGSWPLRMLGLLSYGIYVWHPIAQSIVRWQVPDAGATTTFVAYVCLTVLLAVVTYVLIERPAVKYARRWSGRAAPAPAAPPRPRESVLVS